MWILIKFLLSIVLTEALTEIVTKSEIFLPIRNKIFSIGQKNKFFKWLHKLLDCGYCFSVWAGTLTAFLLLRDLHLISPYIDWFVVGLVIHRLSNLYHNVMDRVHGT